MEPSRRPVTQVFADIEGSTRLWDEQPERMALAVAAHDASRVASSTRIGAVS